MTSPFGYRDAALLSALRTERVELRHPGTDRDVVKDVSLELRRGEILALVGPNGSGKSSLLSALAFDLKPRHGGVYLHGTKLPFMNARGRARRLARLPQEPECAEGVKVQSLVEMGRYAHRGRFDALSEDDLLKVRRALEWMELQGLEARTLETLSGGERRRAWLAMTLAQEAPILLLDEPTGGLDLRHEWELLHVLEELRNTRGLSLIVVLHDLEQAARIADRVAVLHRGRLYRVGIPEKVLDPETLRDVFGIEAELRMEEGRPRLRVHGPATSLRSL